MTCINIWATFGHLHFLVIPGASISKVTFTYHLLFFFFFYSETLFGEMSSEQVGIFSFFLQMKLFDSLLSIDITKKLVKYVSLPRGSACWSARWPQNVCPSCPCMCLDSMLWLSPPEGPKKIWLMLVQHTCWRRLDACFWRTVSPV